MSQQRQPGSVPAFGPSEARAASRARRFVRLDAPFQMHRGGILPRLDVAYETWGELDHHAGNAVLLFTGLSPSAHAASSPEDPASGWWEEMIGPGRPIDTRRWFVICVNSMGSCFGTTGPASIDPRTGQPYRLGFPVLTVEDIAAAGREVVRHLGMRKLHTVVGPSLGGMSALAFCDDVPRDEPRAGGDFLGGALDGVRDRAALPAARNDPLRYRVAGGNYPADKPPLVGMRLARKLGMITYRSAEEWDQRFGRERAGGEHDAGDQFGVDFEIESYLEHHANKFIGQFDPNCYLYLSRAMDLFDVAEHSGCVATELSKPGVERALVIGVETDFLFPLHEQEQLAECLERPGREVEFVALPSLQGHDSFLVDMDGFRPVIARYFDR
jgi:homoserine O-acetyltransferase/O-succinyltransferase